MTHDSRRNPTGRHGDALLFFLLLVASLTLPWSLNASQWAPQGYRLLRPAIVAAFVGLVLARSPLPNWLASFFGTLLGAEYSLQLVGNLMPKWELVWRDTRALGTWLWELVTRQQIQPIDPLSQSLAHANSQLTTLLGKLAVWVQAVSQGIETKDTTFLRLALASIVWLLVLYAALELFRFRRTLHAFLPLGIAVISNVAYTGIGIAYVYLYLAAVLLAMVWAHMTHLKHIWTVRGIDHSSHLLNSAMASGTFLSAAVIVFALAVPYVRLDRAADYFWNTYGTTFEDFYDRLDRAFAGRNPIIAPTPAPRSLGSHQVYQSPQLENTVVFRVTTSDPSPIPIRDYAQDPWLDELDYLDGYLEDVPKRYWRERTYDTYTGRGWTNGQQESEEWAAEIVWKAVPEATLPLTQTFRIVGDIPGYGFAANEPITVDQPYTVITRDRQDLVAFSVSSDRYSVVSRTPDATVDELQAAEEEYADWITERYLSLEGIPEQVQQTARHVVEQVGAETRYEKAVAIEAYLRQFEYDLEVPPAPAGQDVATYFLFDAKRGYCDYSASTMVVMLRSVGVAARYASGFSMGYYDERTEEWVVLESNAHAWPEVYFPGHGWIEFEPTPSQSTFVRPTASDDGEEISLAPPPPIPQREPVEEVTLPPMWWLTALIIVLAVVAVLLAPRILGRHKRSPAQSVWRSYRGALRMARWLGFGPRGGQTPHEYMTALADALISRSRGDGRMLASDIALLEHAYERLRYSNVPVTKDEASSAEHAFRRLRGPLLRLLFRRPGANARAI